MTATFDGEDVTVETERDGQIVAGVSAEGKARQEAEVQAEAEAQAQAEAETQTQQQAQPTEETVVITPSGKKYHRPGCRTLNRSKSLTEISKSDAQARGYESCGVCNP